MSLFFATYGAGGIAQTGKFDAAFFAWYNGIDPDDSTLFMCDQVPPNGQNIYGLCDPAIDAAERVALASNDPATRKRAYEIIQRRLVADRPPEAEVLGSRHVLDPAVPDPPVRVEHGVAARTQVEGDVIGEPAVARDGIPHCLGRGGNPQLALDPLGHGCLLIGLVRFGYSQLNGCTSARLASCNQLVAI